LSGSIHHYPYDYRFFLENLIKMDFKIEYLLKMRSYWILSSGFTLILASISFILSISDSRKVDGPFDLGFPLRFYIKSVFPPNQEFYPIFLIFDLLLCFAISIILMIGLYLLKF